MAIYELPPTQHVKFQPENPLAIRVLVADDPFVCSFLRTVLQRHGHHVVIAEASRASQCLREGGVTADLVITNQPEAFLLLAATVPMLYIAANPDPDLAAQFHNCQVLRKPFRNDALLEAVDELTHVVV